MREIDMWSTSAHGYKCRMGAGTTSNTREGRTVAVTGDMVGCGEGEHKGTETEGKGKGIGKGREKGWGGGGGGGGGMVVVNKQAAAKKYK